jgi:hypothetical protein
MSIIREAGLLAFEWIAGKMVLGVLRLILAAVPIVGKARAGRLAFRWIHLCHRLFSGGCAKATP